MDVPFWRRWHRWLGFPAAVFLLFAAITGVSVAFTEFFGADEALREATRDLVSPVTSASPSEAWTAPIAKALQAVNTVVPNAPIDRIEHRFKGDHPTVTVFVGKPAGGEDRKFVTISGLVIYWRMYSRMRVRNTVGIRRVFW